MPGDAHREGGPSPGAEVARASLVLVQMWQGEPILGADVAGVSPVLVQMWWSPFLVQMWWG